MSSECKAVWFDDTATTVFHFSTFWFDRTGWMKICQLGVIIITVTFNETTTREESILDMFSAHTWTWVCGLFTHVLTWRISVFRVYHEVIFNKTSCSFMSRTVSERIFLSSGRCDNVLKSWTWRCCTFPHVFICRRCFNVDIIVADYWYIEENSCLNVETIPRAAADSRWSLHVHVLGHQERIRLICIDRISIIYFLWNVTEKCVAHLASTTARCSFSRLSRLIS